MFFPLPSGSCFTCTVGASSAAGARRAFFASDGSSVVLAGLLEEDPSSRPPLEGLSSLSSEADFRLVAGVDDSGLATGTAMGTGAGPGFP